MEKPARYRKKPSQMANGTHDEENDPDQRYLDDPFSYDSILQRKSNFNGHFTFALSLEVVVAITDFICFNDIFLQKQIG